MQTLSLQQADIIRILQSRHTQRAIRIINLLLVIWIAAMLASLTWSLLSPQESVVQIETVADMAATPPAVNPDRQLVSQIPNWHLMGVAKEGSQPVAKPTPVDAPDTKLNLVLKGALASDDPDHARAIIADPRGKEEQYAVGEKLPGNAELSEIHPDRVILKRNGRFETLRLPRDKNILNTAASQAPAMAVRTPQSLSKLQQLTAARQKLKAGAANLSNLVRATPKRGEDGKTIGYVLSPGNDPGLFRQVGLQPGDIAIQVNDIKLDNPGNSARALRSIQDGSSVSVTVLRNGQEQVVSLDWPE
jgi:general secretion pathway protein C